METSLILNVVLGSVILLGFMAYVIAIGFSVSKVRVQLNDNERNFDEALKSLHDTMDHIEKDLSERIANLDSRLDSRVDQLDNNINRRIDEECHGLHERIKKHSGMQESDLLA